MKILHTSDWHLGRALYGRKRYQEFQAFLNWLGDLIVEEHIDALLIAGDVFDTSTPSNKSQELYYRFLCRVSASCCQHVIVIGGNHDSPSFLEAPKELLRALNVIVVGSMAGNPEDEVIVLKDSRQYPQAIICAVPYLRDKDIRLVEPGETIDAKNLKLIAGVRHHYERVCALAASMKEAFGKAGHAGVPIVAMGHLFTSGGVCIEGDGVRELYVGSLAHMGHDIFPPSIDYLALGHLHVPQTVGGIDHFRYSGSPIPMGYGEAKQDKTVLRIEFDADTPKISEIKTPRFQELVRVVGTLDDIHARIEQLKEKKSRAWLEIEYSGKDLVSNLQEIMEEALAGSAMEIRRIKNKRIMERLLGSAVEEETLDDLDPGDVFVRCLDTFEIPENDRIDLTASYNEILTSLTEEDQNVE